VSLNPEINAARHDVHHARAKLSDTITELENRLTAPVKAVRERVDVGSAVQRHPWIAIAAAVGAGAAVAASGVDKRAAAVAVEKAKQGGAAGVRAAKEAPSRGRRALDGAIGAIGAKLAMTLIEALREPRVPLPAPERQEGLGYLENPAPAHEARETF